MALVVDGQERVMKLTLGALAELEQEVPGGSIMELVERFESGAFTSQDLLALLAAGLKGGGNPVSRQALGAAEIEGGPMGAARAGAELLVRAFSMPGGE